MVDANPKQRGIFFGLEVTRRCNLSCPHCFTASDGEAHPGPNREQFRELWRQLVAAGARHAAFSGGEPLARRDLEVLMADGLQLGMKSYSMVTNGVLASARRVRDLKALGLVTAQVSLDGVDRRDHCAIRECSSEAYYRALRAVRLYRDAGVKVDIATVLLGPNLERNAEMLLLGQALGVRKLRYCSFVPTGRASQTAVRDRCETEAGRVDSFLAALRAFRAQPKPALDLVIDHGIGPWREDGRFQCVAGRAVVYITGEGDLYPCPSLMFEAFKVGNVYEEGLARLLEDPRLHLVRRIPRAELAEPCRSCANVACSGGCRGAAYAATGDVRAAPAYCNVQRRVAGWAKVPDSTPESPAAHRESDPRQKLG